MFTRHEAGGENRFFPRCGVARERERGSDRDVSGGSRVNIFRRNQLGEVIMGRFAEKIRSDPLRRIPGEIRSWANCDESREIKLMRVAHIRCV